MPKLHNKLWFLTNHYKLGGDACELDVLVSMLEEKPQPQLQWSCCVCSLELKK